MVLFYKIWKKYNKIQLTENKIDFNNRKMTNHPPSPAKRRNTDALVNLYFSKLTNYYQIFLQLYVIGYMPIVHCLIVHCFVD